MLEHFPSCFQLLVRIDQLLSLRGIAGYIHTQGSHDAWGSTAFCLVDCGGNCFFYFLPQKLLPRSCPTQLPCCFLSLWSSCGMSRNYTELNLLHRNIYKIKSVSLKKTTTSISNKGATCTCSAIWDIFLTAFFLVTLMMKKAIMELSYHSVTLYG